MDRINAFLQQRKRKNKKIVKVKDKEYELTIDDFKKVKRYMNNECLDTIELYQPMNTSYTRTVRETPIELRKSRRKILQRIPKKIDEDHKKYKIDNNIWYSLDVVDMEPYNCVELYDNTIPISDLVSPTQNFNKIFSKLVHTYFRPQRKHKEITSNKIEVNCEFPKEYAKCYDISNILARNGRFLLTQNDNNVELFDLFSSKLLRRLIPLNYTSFYISNEDIYYSLDNKIYKSSDTIDELIYEYSSKIYKIFINEKYLIFSTEKNILIVNQSSKNEIKIKNKKYLNFKLVGDDFYILSRENLRLYSIKARKFNKYKTSAKSFSVGKILIMGDNENIIFREKDVIRYLSQEAYVKNVCSHDKLPLFGVLLSNEIRIFFYKNSGVKLCN
ncbi:hypothetical protein H311_02798, partial [Anncaliia algerae PRA109]